MKLFNALARSRERRRAAEVTQSFNSLPSLLFVLNFNLFDERVLFAD